MWRLLPLLLLLSCNDLVKILDDSYYEKIDSISGADHLKVLFSHNINGETHPCGCRKFPLGGLAQVAGYMHEAKSNSPVIYVDTGDMLFPSPNVPDTLKDSITFSANKIGEAQKMHALKLFVPGDQDFALGVKFLETIAKKNNFSILATNLSPKSKLESKKFAAYNIGNRKVVFLGVVDPSLLGKEKESFISPAKAIKEALEAIKAELEGDYDEAVIILLSHSGLDSDEQLAKRFPDLDWIIGAHSQSFLKSPDTVGNTKIVQALSRNHYLGEISIPFNDKKEGSYKLIPMAEDVDKKHPNNPFNAWLSSYKSQLEKIQQEEQKKLSENFSSEAQKINTYLNCSECHRPQTEFWQGTAHALAWHTLRDAKAANNSQCIGCHSVGFQKPEGFITSEHIVEGEKFKTANIDQYWKEVDAAFKGVKSIRELDSKKRKAISQKWVKIDEKHNVERNFANVQCMNCHNQHPEHPFNMGDHPKQADFSKNCLNCHTADQSPEWYSEDKNGLATTPNKKYIEAQIKRVGCPKM